MIGNLTKTTSQMFFSPSLCTLFSGITDHHPVVYIFGLYFLFPPDNGTLKGEHLFRESSPKIDLLENATWTGIYKNMNI